MAARAIGSKSRVGTATQHRPIQSEDSDPARRAQGRLRVDEDAARVRAEFLHAEQVGPRRANLRGGRVAEIPHTEPR